MRKILTVLAVAGVLFALAPAAQAKAAGKPPAPGCTITTTQPADQSSATFSASYVGLKNGDTTRLLVNGTAVSNPYTVTDPGTYSSSCEIRNRKNQVIASSAGAPVTVVEPAPTVSCSFTSTDNGDGTGATIAWQVSGVSGTYDVSIGDTPDSFESPLFASGVSGDQSGTGQAKASNWGTGTFDLTLFVGNSNNGTMFDPIACQQTGSVTIS